MRRLICAVAALLLCVALAGPAYAVEEPFVPSITYKPMPQIVPVTGEDGHEHLGVILDENGAVMGYVDEGCLVVTPIAHIWDKTQEVPEDVRRLLMFVYDGLTSDEMVLPYDQCDTDTDPSDIIIRDLFDARWGCQNHCEIVNHDGVVFEMTFDLGVAADTEVFVMTYDEDSKEWSPIVNVTNNGDGTVTCTFEHLCAVAFSMTLEPTAVPAVETTAPDAMLWITVMVVAAAAIVAMLISRNKKVSAMK
jgi:hypothetical protein